MDPASLFSISEDPFHLKEQAFLVQSDLMSQERSGGQS